MAERFRPPLTAPSWRRHPVAGVACLVALLEPVVAVADVQLMMGPDLPFSREEIRRAVTLRLPPGGPASNEAREPTIVRLQSLSGTLVSVSCRGRQRIVDYAGMTRELAVRQMALAVYDLVRSEVTLPEPPASAKRTMPRHRSAREGSPRVPARPPAGIAAAPDRSRPLLLLGLLATLGAGSNVDRIFLQGSLEGSLHLRRSLRWFLDFGGSWTPAADLVDGSLSLVRLSLRTGPSWRPWSWPLELRLAAVLEPYWIDGAAADHQLSHRGALGGAGTSLLYTAHLSRGLFALAALGVDVYFNRAEFQVRGASALASERIAFWAALGAAWGIGAR